ncbi:hypothetical protein [Pseudonocardia sp.]|uniref:hypothetical protein n=2 Tax=Pseudonocardia sp. TaxID=60912 RepID=UPI003D106161
MSAVVGALVTLNVDAVRSWLSERNPVVASFSPVEQPAYNGFTLVAPDASTVPAAVADTTDCDLLWDQGVQAGAIPVDERIQRLVMSGEAKDGIVVTGMRARVTQRGPADGDAALWCPGAGELSPIGFAFDLRGEPDGPAIEVAEAVRHSTDPTVPESPVTQFADGFAIALKEHEPVSLVLHTSLPEESIRWFVEVDVLVGGEPRTVRIDDGGEDFYSPGTRKEPNGYRTGTTAGVEFAGWGVVPEGVVHDSAGGRVVDHSGLQIPVPDGEVDVYRPFEAGIPSGYRAVRVDGRVVARFNPAGVAPESAPAVGQDCGQLGSGYIESVSEVSRRDVGGVERDAWDVTCSEGARFRYVQVRLGGGTTVVSAVVGPDDDMAAAAALLDGVRLSSMPPAVSATVEPVVALADVPATEDGPVSAPTDVGYIVEAFEDSRGVVVRFDKVDYRDGAVGNSNPAIRTVISDGNGSTPDLEKFRRDHVLVVLARTADGTLTGFAAVR